MDPFTAILVNLIIGVVLSAASTLLQQALSPKGDAARGFRGTIQTGGKVPRSFLVGTIGVPGKLVYRNAWGASGGTPNANLVDVISFGDLPISAFIGLYVNSAPVTVPATGHVLQGYPVPEYVGSGGANHLWREFFDGTQTTVNPYLAGKFGADTDRPWSDDMVGRGVPYLTLTARINDTLWTGFPSYMAVFQGIPLYDPRKDSTAGGDGDHRWDDQSTWEFSDNNLVIVYNILRGIQYDGARVWGGEARAYQLPFEPWAAAMDRCDEAIALDAGGSERRYRAGREIGFNERPADVVIKLLTGANARIAYAGGCYYPLVDIPDVADFEFTDADVIVTEETTLDALPNLDQVINGATATYMEPAQAWEDKETAPYLRADLVAADDNREQMEGLGLATTFSGTQAQRVLKATVEESRRFGKHVVPLRPAFGQYRPLQVAAWMSDANQYDGKLFLVTAKTEDRFGRVVMGLLELDPSDSNWNPATDEQPLSFSPMTPIRPAPQVMSGWGVAPYTFPDASDTDRRFGIEVEFAGEMPDVGGVRVQVKEDFGDDRLVFDSPPYPYDVEEEDPSRIVSSGALIPDTDYLVRGKFVPISERVTEWSDWLPVKTPNIKLGAADIDIDLDDIAAGLTQQLGQLNRALRSLRDRVESAGTLLSDQDLANADDRKVLLRQIEAVSGEANAGYLEVIEAIASQELATSQKFETVYASLGGSTAEVLIKFEAVAAPAGIAARYSIVLSADDGDTFNPVGLYLEKTSGGVSRIVLVADQTVVSSDAGATIAALFKAGTTYLADARIEDASIEGAKIKDAAIGSAKIANAAITSAKINDLAVTTIKIEDGAVTDLVTDSKGTTVRTGAGNWWTFCSVTVVSVGYIITIGAKISVTVGPSIGSRGGRLVANGVIIDQTDWASTGPPATLTDTLTGLMFEAPGTYTVELQFANGTNTDTLNYGVVSAAGPQV